MYEVRTATAEDTGACLDIVGGLPEYFTPDVPAKLRRDMAHCRTWLVADGCWASRP